MRTVDQRRDTLSHTERNGESAPAAAAAAPGAADEGPRPVAQLAENLDTIGTALRLLATRIAELETEVARQSATADQLRTRLGEQLGANQAAACARCEAELAALQATRLLRWSRAPRQTYRRVLLLRHPRRAARLVRARLEARR